MFENAVAQHRSSGDFKPYPTDMQDNFARSGKFCALAPGAMGPLGAFAIIGISKVGRQV
ncbi:hypothetical protein [Novosphingobium resinovorum]|uniref:hypothetical protein n=1 Tax=Novosphingobium resinovorum TaxID=158500 RepID=UPI002ED4680D